MCYESNYHCKHISLYKLLFFIKENIYPRVSQRITKSNWFCYVSWNIMNFFFSFFFFTDRKSKYSIFKIFPNKRIRFHYLCDINAHQPRINPGDILGTHRKYIESRIMYSVRHVDGGIRHYNDEVPVFEVSH